MGKDWKSCKLGKMAILSHSELLHWEKIGKVANQPKLAVPSHSKLLWWKRWEKLQIRQNWLFQVILSDFYGKRLEKL